MSKIIYIAGTGYCGSTVLEMCLGSHPKITNFGEIDRILNVMTIDELRRRYAGIYGGG